MNSGRPDQSAPGGRHNSRRGRYEHFTTFEPARHFVRIDGFFFLLILTCFTMPSIPGFVTRTSITEPTLKTRWNFLSFTVPLAFLTVCVTFFFPHALPMNLAVILDPAGTLLTRNTVNLVDFAPGEGKLKLTVAAMRG